VAFRSLFFHLALVVRPPVVIIWPIYGLLLLCFVSVSFLTRLASGLQFVLFDLSSLFCGCVADARLHDGPGFWVASGRFVCVEEVVILCCWSDCSTSSIIYVWRVHYRMHFYEIKPGNEI
jgi:hypothetical protein